MTAPAARPRIARRWWTPPAPDPEIVARLERELRLPHLVCSLLGARGYQAPEDAKLYLRPRLEHLADPMLFKGMDRAVERLSAAIRNKETILVHGDYDVDGMCSTTIMVKVLRHLGATAVPFAPHRMTDGYDLTDAGVDAAVQAGARLVLTCDCGTSAHAAIARLNGLGVDVIVSDHHLPGSAVPECVAVLNPRQDGCAYPDKDLCAAGVAFKLSQALLAVHGASENVALRLLDLVALATVADVAPLRGENRTLVRYGLRLMADSPNPGLRALMEAASLLPAQLNAGRLGFTLGPRLNAAGRVGHALRGIDLLLSDDPAECRRIARELEEMNRARQEIELTTLEAARALAAPLDLTDTWGVALGAPGWHPGVIGIVASRMVEELCRPVVMVAFDEGIGKGSGRSIPAFDLHAGLSACSDLFERFGGHKAAAGITIQESRMPEFQERFNTIAHERLTADDLIPVIRIDIELSADDVTSDLESLLRHFEPFGMGNPAPQLAVRGARVAGAPRAVGKNGLKCWLQSSNGPLEALGWGMSDRLGEFGAGDTIDVAFKLDRDSYRGTSKLVARLTDVRI